MAAALGAPLAQDATLAQILPCPAPAAWARLISHRAVAWPETLGPSPVIVFTAAATDCHLILYAACCRVYTSGPSIDGNRSGAPASRGPATGDQPLLGA